MQTLSITDSRPMNLEAARDQAVAKAREQLPDPVVMSWRRADGTIAPRIPGADTAQRWRDHGAANGGVLEVVVGDDYRPGSLRHEQPRKN